MIHNEFEMGMLLLFILFVLLLYIFRNELISDIANDIRKYNLKKYIKK